MFIFKSKKELQHHLAVLGNGKTIGFTATMGALHLGHMHLIKQSNLKCDISICSIFVNPTQFNNPNDLAKYPNTLKADLEMLEKVKCDIVYNPPVNDLYGKGETAKSYDFGSLTTGLEGKFRPGHFNGMATIIEKLLVIIKPTIAFFGQKDLQQLYIVKNLAEQMQSNTLIEGVETVRGKSGLAKSSRNKLLSEGAKKEASLIYNCLNYCKNNKEEGVHKLKHHIQQEFLKHENFTLEYVEFVALKTMLPMNDWQGLNKNAVCISAYHSGVRLIDNIIL
jgi:pantoate--beta-alanine ligase